LSGTSLGVFVNEVYFSPIPSIVDLTGAKRREWMGMGVAGMILDGYYGSFPKIPC